MSKASVVATIIICVLLSLACNLSTPTMVSTPMATQTATATPVIIVVTAMPEPTPTADLYDLVLMPDEVYRFAAQLMPVCGNDFRYAPRLGIQRDTIVYLQYEAPIGSDRFYIARYRIVDDRWLLLDTTALEKAMPTPQPGRGWPEGEVLMFIMDSREGY